MGLGMTPNYPHSRVNPKPGEDRMSWSGGRMWHFPTFGGRGKKWVPSLVSRLHVAPVLS
ncbi:CDP-diacylglycerol-glycerol-3-phosphate 3-phosphatidyltransferase [Aspergillus luchuensis]|uniref:CDP-diacylglycerol-glycerol-3-phosphate 3-phosphatidyltransferase n=1 Tax=Aspergillus kawachii TaxID=1069201 RepID=A0A146F473_ASPKA|nr:CDP-diacylglycerol-glycerol-3-phosphate 3-phosphatidyltransferase [Aspergillus luchuensis]